MKSKKQKILHEVGGKPMVLHVFEAAEQVADVPPVLVVGPGARGVQALIGPRALYVEQLEQLGTGHAARMARSVLLGGAEQVLVTYGDMPLLRAETMRRMAQAQAETGAAMSLLAVMGQRDSTYGRLVRDDNGRVLEVVEVAEAKKRPNPDHYLNILELNAGVYCFDAAWLWQNIGDLPLRQARNSEEYYLTDMVEIAVKQGLRVEPVSTEDADEWLGAGTRAEMVAVERAFRRRANYYWLERGVTLVDPDSVYIDPDVKIGQDTVIWPNTFVQGHTVVGEDCVLGPNVIVRDAVLGDGCWLERVTVERQRLGAGVIRRGI
ncbi:MAG: NTP transferase domain-containing protein [Ardenticatenaceae bacterium]|nr:NTP transferase domain-containing protein [Ardenticatenaceae bacterium]